LAINLENTHGPHGFPTPARSSHIAHSDDRRGAVRTLIAIAENMCAIAQVTKYKWFI